MTRRKTSIAVDEEILQEARRILGTTTPKEAVGGALLRVLTLAGAGEVWVDGEGRYNLVEPGV